MDTATPIYLAGHNGLFGKAMQRVLKAHGYGNVLTRRHAELDLANQAATEAFFAEHRPKVVILAAAKVGGIFANMADPLSFIRDNLAIQSNVFDAAHRHGAEKLLFLGSSCIYPRACPQPMVEEHFLTGPVEPTNQGYAIAKIAGVQLCLAHNAARAKSGSGLDCRAIQPPNLFGEGDHFGPSGHALAGMMHRMHHAKLKGDSEFVVWGSGKACREWMYVDDAADAALHALTMPDWDAAIPFLNTGSGVEYAMGDLAREIQKVVGFEGALTFDTSKPDGMPRKLMDSSKFLATGWQPKVSFAEGLARTYAYYRTLPDSQPQV